MPHDHESFQDGSEQGWQDNAAQRGADAKLITALTEALTTASADVAYALAAAESAEQQRVLRIALDRINRALTAARIKIC